MMTESHYFMILAYIDFTMQTDDQFHIIVKLRYGVFENCNLIILPYNNVVMSWYIISDFDTGKTSSFRVFQYFGFIQVDIYVQFTNTYSILYNSRVSIYFILFQLYCNSEIIKNSFQ